jgi:hypothetical protein
VPKSFTEVERRADRIAEEFDPELERIVARAAPF